MRRRRLGKADDRGWREQDWLLERRKVGRGGFLLRRHGIWLQARERVQEAREYRRWQQRQRQLGGLGRNDGSCAVWGRRGPISGASTVSFKLAYGMLATCRLPATVSHPLLLLALRIGDVRFVCPPSDGRLRRGPLEGCR